MWNEARRKAYGKRLAELRQGKKLRREAAALAMEMRPQTLKELERGERRPYEPSQLKIAQFYGVDGETLQPATESQSKPLSKAATVEPSSQQTLDDEFQRHWEGGLLSSLTGHLSAISAIYKIAAAVRDFPDKEETIAHAVEHAVAEATRNRVARPKS